MITRQRTSLEGRITIDPTVLGGKPVVRGTRIPVELVLKRLSEELDPDALIEAFPRLTKRDIQACIEYAQSLVEGEALYPAPARPGRSRRTAR